MTNVDFCKSAKFDFTITYFILVVPPLLTYEIHEKKKIRLDFQIKTFSHNLTFWY